MKVACRASHQPQGKWARDEQRKEAMTKLKFPKYHLNVCALSPKASEAHLATIPSCPFSQLQDLLPLCLSVEVLRWLLPWLHCITMLHYLVTRKWSPIPAASVKRNENVWMASILLSKVGVKDKTRKLCDGITPQQAFGFREYTVQLFEHKLRNLFIVFHTNPCFHTSV